MSHDLARRWIDLALVGELAARDRGSLHDHLRSCDECRAHYDRGALALRVLEDGEDLSAHELDMVEGWLFEDATQTAPSASPAWWRRPWIGLGAALAGAAAAVFLLLPPGDDGGGIADEMTARGDAADAGLGLQVLCGDPLREADEGGCRLDEAMTFAYRLPPTAPHGRLVLFGVDGHGDTLYYAPTPVDATLLDTISGEWTPVPLTIDLEVNHEAGPLTVFALVTTNAADVGDVDAWAAALRDQAPARVGDDPWPQRMSSQLLEGTCESGTCRAAEVSLQLHEADR